MDVKFSGSQIEIKFPWPPPPEKDQIKQFGARWQPDRKVWAVPLSDRLAAWLTQHQVALPEAAQAELTAKAEQHTATLEASRATNADVEIPKPDGLDYLPFQKAGIAWALARPASLIGDEPGLGKTMQALGVINSHPEWHNVLIVAPHSMAINWQRETQKWLVEPRTIGIASTKALPDADIVIASWSRVSKHAQALRARQWDAIILDEAHLAKNPKAKRTQAIYGYDDLRPLQAPVRLALTGTPIPNRPIEIQPTLKWLAPAEFGNWVRFGTRYAAGDQTRFGWDMSGSSHRDELQDRLRSTVMVRRKKMEVLTELPPKTRQVVSLDADTTELKAALKAERAIQTHANAAIQRAQIDVELAKASDEETYRQAVDRLRQAQNIAFTEMSKVRHDTAVAKVPTVAEHVRELLDGGVSKIVIFAHHHDVIEGLAAAFAEATKDQEAIPTVRAVGGMPADTKQAAVDAFQTDPTVRIFLGSIQAVGVGITLTAANHMVFAELDWVPGNITQAEDRIHRIGQKDAVTIQHVLLDGSIDAKMAQTVIQKQAIIDQILDTKAAQGEEIEADDYGSEEVEYEPDAPAATKRTSREEIATRAEHITPDQIARVHAGLKALAGLDADFARARNEVGFSKIDAAIGHDLAQLPSLSAKQAALGAKMLAKYHRQLDPETAGIWAAVGKALELAPGPDDPNPAATLAAKMLGEGSTTTEIGKALISEFGLSPVQAAEAIQAATPEHEDEPDLSL